MHCGIALKPATSPELVFPYVDAGLVRQIYVTRGHGAGLDTCGLGMQQGRSELTPLHMNHVT